MLILDLNEWKGYIEGINVIITLGIPVIVGTCFVVFLSLQDISSTLMDNIVGFFLITTITGFFVFILPLMLWMLLLTGVPVITKYIVEMYKDKRC